MSPTVATSTRRLATSLTMVAAALGASACSSGGPTAPKVPAESNAPVVVPEREAVCRQGDSLRPRIAPGFCPPPGR